MNWDMESNYICPTVNNNYPHLTDCGLQTNPSTTTIQNPQTKLSTDNNSSSFQSKLLLTDNDEEIQHDGTTQQQSIGTTKQNFTSYANADLNGKYR
jgi:hypothetical protein